MYKDYTNLNFDFLKQKGGVGFVDSWEFNKHNSYAQELYQGVLKRIDLYEEFKEGALDNFCALILPMSVDQIWLFRHKELLFSYLEQGGIVLNFVASFCEYLPNLSLYEQSMTPIRVREIKLSKHIICDGVREYDINYRRGVKGFFSRGFLNPPQKAEIILTDSDGKCVAYIDRSSSKGIILNTAGADFFAYSLYDHDSSKRMPLNTLLWLENELKAKV
ncbi:aspartate/tyrosine/aromatic aminotransferase [Campylobacter sp. MIT 99-7217]|uniref:aspartate/tyrosine/aromatic aminotransferase n=1 Tax=Campylobacter sp. MIT 99-7217 TaxID=535091 RepID=UPI001159DF40|nr:aspartate/tyrosine/aromatic aminotransferase [Campylobacter sp. MIT 99-7217]TQR33702.1 aspartate/tyrosine/aromatic aminotransferase [Campylobacter sp. MIT 99-7217]